MPAMIFVNFAVESMAKARAFYEAMGFTANEQFCSDDTACMAWSEAIYLMLLEKERFQSFTDKRIVDAEREVEVLNALSVDSREAVDAMLAKALAAGGRELREAQDYGFMYSRGFSDPDHHSWDIVWMNPAHLEQ